MSEKTTDVTMDDIVSLCKRRGFIYPGSDVYGGLSGTWDYGPLGVALKRNIMQLWWKMFVDDREDMFGVDAAILMNQKVWQASGHTETFTDPLITCDFCKKSYRVDKLINADELNTYLNDLEQSENTRLMEKGNTTSFESMIALINAGRHYIGPIVSGFLNDKIFLKCENCKNVLWSPPKSFNMMFKTHVGPNYSDSPEIKQFGETPGIEVFLGEWKVNVNNPTRPLLEENEIAKSSISYLRPETAQGIFTNFKNVVDSFYPDMPFGLAQQGKAFRNEISPRDFIFRSREFEQMEIEYFVHPDNWEAAFEMWIKLVHEWTDALGLPATSVHELEVEAADRAHYSKRTVDFEFDFPIGREELLGLAYRTDFDLMNIQNNAKKSMEYRPKDGGAAYVPHVIEPSFGLERAIMAALTAAYVNDPEHERIVLKLPKHLSPVKVAVSPLLKNKPELVAKAREVYSLLKKEFGAVMWDDNGNIGKRYRRQDEIGTPYCVVIDFETIEGDTAGTVTVRDRDTTQQTRVSIAELTEHLK